MSDHPDRVGIDRLVGKAVEEYFERSARGERPQVKELADRYPEISDLLKVVIPALQAAEDTSDSPVSCQVAHDKQHRQLGDFRILRQIGRGGMGVVYEAEQLSMARHVALKVLPLAGLVDESQIRRFQNEVRAAASLSHPNIVSVYMVGEERGVHFYAMQLIRGRSLAEVISSLRRLREHGEGLDGSSVNHAIGSNQADEIGKENSDDSPETEIFVAGSTHGEPSQTDTVDMVGSSTSARSSRREYYRSVMALGIQAATALQHAHDEGIVHRDIKPANLLLDESSKLYLTDFGLARIEGNVGVTMTGDLIGTLRYMAPEQALAKRVVVDHRADIYSLAATLYELLTLRPAYVAEDRQQLLKQIAFEEPTPLRRIDRGIPAELETIIHKAMAKDMDQRYSSAQELADDLRSHLENRPIKARRPTTFEIIGKWTRRNLVLTWAAIVTLTLVTITLTISTIFVANQRNVVQDKLRQLEKGNNLLAFMFDSLDIGAIAKREKELEPILTDCLVRVGHQLKDDSVGDPLVVASMQVKLGCAVFSLGDASSAAEILEQAFQTQSQLGESPAKIQMTAAMLESVRRAIAMRDADETADEASDDLPPPEPSEPEEHAPLPDAPRPAAPDEPTDDAPEEPQPNDELPKSLIQQIFSDSAD